MPSMQCVFSFFSLQRLLFGVFALTCMIFISSPLKAEVHGDWRLNCENDGCQASQQLFFGEGEERSRVLLASVLQVQQDLLLQMVLPLGVDLRPGIVVRIDQAEEQSFNFVTCVADGCVVLLPLKSKLLSAMRAGNKVKVGFRPFSSDQTLIVELSLSGFTKAIKGVR